MSTTISFPSYGYFSVRVSKQGGTLLLRSNSERAFVLAQLQDLLGVRTLLEDPESRKRLSAHVDLLAYSINGSHVQLLIFSLSRTDARALSTIIKQRLQQYQSEYCDYRTAQAHSISIKRLRGKHQALSQSIDIHCAHQDWEYDRYSSIGFYLHDRRGDWMRIWRLSKLFDNDPEIYRLLIEDRLSRQGGTSSPEVQMIGS